MYHNKLINSIQQSEPARVGSIKESCSIMNVIKKSLTSSGTAKSRVTSFLMAIERYQKGEQFCVVSVSQDGVLLENKNTRPHRPYPVPPKISPPSSSSTSSFGIA